MKYRKCVTKRKDVNQAPKPVDNDCVLHSSPDGGIAPGMIVFGLTIAMLAMPLVCKLFNNILIAIWGVSVNEISHWLYVVPVMALIAMNVLVIRVAFKFTKEFDLITLPFFVFNLVLFLTLLLYFDPH